VDYLDRPVRFTGVANVLAHNSNVVDGEYVQSANSDVRCYVTGVYLR